MLSVTAGDACGIKLIGISAPLLSAPKSAGCDTIDANCIDCIINTTSIGVNVIFISI